MSGFHGLSIRWKVTLVSVLASGIVLVVASLVFLEYGRMQARNDLERSLQMRADLLASVSSAPIAFDDRKSAAEIVDALRGDPRIAAAALYRADRSLFVSYQRGDDRLLPELESLMPEGRRWTAGHLLLAHPIDFKGARSGYLLVASDLDYLRNVVHRSIAVAVAALAICFALGWMLSSRLQRLVTRPILTLVDVANTISRSADYSLRVPVQGTDELALLGTSFNEMLRQIDRRDAELAAARDALESRVKERTRELVRQTEELTRSNADLEQFAYVASHDLQEPLRMVASYTQLLAETTKGTLGRDAQDYVDYAIDGALRMQNLINDLLAYSRVSRANTAFVPLDVASVVAQALKNLELAIAESGARVVVDAMPSLPGHSSQLIQLFQNLIANAVKFRSERTPEIHITAVRLGDATEFAVRDNGIGFDPKYAPKVFVIFHRLHARGRYPGTGIGLAVCKRIVEHHGGQIRVESTPGKGTTFYFTLAHEPVGAPTAKMEEDSAHDAIQA